MPGSRFFDNDLERVGNVFAFTLIRAPLASHFYPYPFVDVTDLGYARVAVDIAVITVFFIALAAGAVALERRLPSRA